MFIYDSSVFFQGGKTFVMCFLVYPYRKFLAIAWTIAVGEPTPTGEIVASVLTILYAGVWLYEVIVCRDTDEEGYCYERFEDCVSPIPDGCSQCLQYCLVNGYWPSYSTRQCS